MCKKCISSPGITEGVGQCEFHYNIVNFHQKRSIPKAIPSEVEVSVVKLIVITQDDCTCICICNAKHYNLFKCMHIKLL